MNLSPHALCSNRHRSRWSAARWLAASCLAFALVAHGGAPAAGAEPGFKVVVHPSNPVASLSADTLRKIFLKQKVRWDDGETIKPVDVSPQLAVREAFSSQVLARSVQAVRSYWLQRIFSGGHVPPPELHSDQAVIKYVAGNRGGVGYVSAAADVSSVKVVAVR